jgi:hypothetical protein
MTDASATKLTDITVLVPFDIGESYVFKPPADVCERCIWKNIFRPVNHNESDTESKWSTERIGEASAFYREPFGPIARYRPSSSATIEELTSLFRAEGKCFAGFDSLEVIFFPRGVGILVLRAQVQELSGDWRKDVRRDREQLKEVLKPHIRAAQVSYRMVMDRAMADERFKGFVFAVNLPRRRREISEVRFPYAIAFTAGDCPKRKRYDPARAASLSHYRPLRYRYVNTIQTTKTTAEQEIDVALSIDVGWVEATVYSGASADWPYARVAVEDAFTVAMASWFSLVLMSSLVSRSIRDSFIHLADNRQKLSDKEGQTIRFAFMDASNASRPVRWTFRERDILLLDRINEVWSTKRWWRSIEERAALLNARHNEVATERRRKAEKNLNILVIVLGTITALTAVRDIADTFGALGEKGKHAGWALVAMVVMVVLAAGILLRGRSDEIEK